MTGEAPFSTSPHWPQENAQRGKTRDKAKEMKTTRRAEIEKRAAELETPISAHVLALIPSFQAAIQITSPLDDEAWNRLKPRLIAQCQDTKLEQYSKQTASAHCQVARKESANQLGQQKLTAEAKRKADKAWDGKSFT